MVMTLYSHNPVINKNAEMMNTIHELWKESARKLTYSFGIYMYKETSSDYQVAEKEHEPLEVI